MARVSVPAEKLTGHPQWVSEIAGGKAEGWRPKGRGWKLEAIATRGRKSPWPPVLMPAAAGDRPATNG